MDRILGRLAEDPAATTYDAADGAGRRFVYTVGTAAGTSEYATWAKKLMAVAGRRGLAGVHSGGLGADGRPFLVTEAGGRTLAEALTTEPPGPDVVLKAIGDVADGLATLHARGLRHGAVCPSTIVLDGTGTARLAGFDTRAPEMGLSWAPGTFAAPEGDGEAPADVYALAAVAYIALGGTLPAGIGDLPAGGLVTGLLRTALHPDPTARPGAATLRDALSTVAVNGPAIAALPKERVTAMARPVNDTVATAVPPVGPPQDRFPKLALVVVGLAVLAASVFVGARAGGTGAAAFTPAQPPAAAPAPATYDFKTLGFTDPGGEAVTLADGAAEAESGTWVLAGDPGRSDLDGDGDADAVVALRHETSDGDETYLTAFVLADGKMTQAKNWATGVCEVSSLTAEGTLIAVKLQATNPSLGCGEKGAFVDETVKFGLRDGWFVRSAPVLGAPDRCHFAEGDEPRDYLAPVVPHVAASQDSPEMPGRFTTIYYNKPDTGKWALARLTGVDGIVSCGWIPIVTG